VSLPLKDGPGRKRPGFIWISGQYVPEPPPDTPGLTKYNRKKVAASLAGIKYDKNQVKLERRQARKIRKRDKALRKRALKAAGIPETRKKQKNAAKKEKQQEILKKADSLGLLKKKKKRKRDSESEQNQPQKSKKLKRKSTKGKGKKGKGKGKKGNGKGGKKLSRTQSANF